MFIIIHSYSVINNHILLYIVNILIHFFIYENGIVANITIIAKILTYIATFFII